jgi:hypothetical protein
MVGDKINISWDELKTSKVEKHLQQQQAVARNQRYAKMSTGDVKVTADATPSGSIWYNSVFRLAVFGLLGGLLAWGCGQLLHLRSDPRHEADEAISAINEIRATITTKAGDEGITASQAQAAIDNVVRGYPDNAYLQVFLNDSLSAADKDAKRAELDDANKWKNLLVNLLGFGLCGIMVSVCLSVAEPVIDRNMPAFVIGGAVGTLLGLVGGLAAAIVIDQIYVHLGSDSQIARAASWGVLGCFISIAPGIVARNFKRTLIGMVGGSMGGIIGGMMLQPATVLSGNNPEIGKLVAMLFIGLVAGIATGTIESVARSGWLKVTQGLIAGKQFILYRNPTFIGSAPDCQIYLFRDPVVGRKHAAIHIQKGRFELEDLPLGGRTMVNGEIVTRKKLRDGDKIKIGATEFVFQEKTAKPAEE